MSPPKAVIVRAKASWYSAYASAGEPGAVSGCSVAISAGSAENSAPK